MSGRPSRGVKKAAAEPKKPKEKDPNAPKRPMSAYFHWLGENRAALKKPGMGVAEIAKEAGVQWAKLTDKSKWEKMAQDDKQRYEKDMTAYKAKKAAAEKK